MKHHFIINPAAGKGTHVNTLSKKIEAAATEAGIDFEIYYTTCIGDAAVYVASVMAADGERHRFYACGGDGTLSECVNGAPTDERAEFALIPIGTGNDFCRNFDDRAAFFDIARQIEGTPTPIDLIRYNDRYCVNMLNIGFDCHVVERTMKFKKSKLIPSGMAYTVGVAATLLHKLTTDMHIELEDGEVIDRPLLLMTVGNGRYYGGGYCAAPLASIDDGLLDVNIIEKVSRLTFLSLVGSYKAGNHLETAKKYVTYRRARTLCMHFAEETMLCADGETEYITDLAISLVPSATRFVLPLGVHYLFARPEPTLEIEAETEEAPTYEPV